MKERKLKYTTLKGLLSKTRQFSLSTLLSGRFYHKTKGWINYTLSDELRDEITGLFEEFLNTPINLNISSWGIYERLVLDKRGVHYIAGQDYPSEIREIKRLIKRG